MAARPWPPHRTHVLHLCYSSVCESRTGQTGGVLGWPSLRWLSGNSPVRLRRPGKYKNCLLYFKVSDTVIFGTRAARWGSISDKPAADSPAMRPTIKSSGYKARSPIRRSQSRLQDGGSLPKNSFWAACPRHS